MPLASLGFTAKVASRAWIKTGNPPPHCLISTVVPGVKPWAKSLEQKLGSPVSSLMTHCWPFLALAMVVTIFTSLLPFYYRNLIYGWKTYQGLAIFTVRVLQKTAFDQSTFPTIPYRQLNKKLKIHENLKIPGTKRSK
jgi:hypothetical protein